MKYVMIDYLAAWWGYRRRHYNDTNSEGNKFITNDDL